MEVQCLALKDLSSPRKSSTVGPEEEEDGARGEQKENMCAEKRKSTPLKSAESTLPTLLINRKGAPSELTHITPIKHTSLTEPWTPTANLKMLISAASPDIRDREMKKVLFRPIENDKDQPASPDNVVEDPEVEDSSGSNRKDKSLRIMSQKFVMLFLVSKTQTVTLDAAAKVLIEESQDSSSHSKYKTKVRRLYDIANVLTSLSLIKKVHVREERGRKPAFKWLGPVEFSSCVNAGNTLNVAAIASSESAQPLAGQELRKAKMARHASFSITPTSVAVQRQVSSAPSSPRREVTALQNQPVDYSRRTTSSSAACQLQFGSNADNRPGTPPQTQLIHNSTTVLSPSSTHSTLLAPHPHPEHLFAASPSSHCLAYLPSLSQPSVVMLYRPPETPNQMLEGHTSPRLEATKRKKEEREEEEMVLKKKGNSALEKCEKTRAEACRETAECSQAGTRASPSRAAGLCREQVIGESGGGNSSSEHAQPSHYLYVPNNAGLNGLNFLLSAGQPAASLALPPSSVPTLALPYVLVPSAALSHYPLVAGGLQQQGSDAHTKLSFGLPAMMSPAHFMVGGAPYSVVPVPPPSTPEQSGLYRSSVGTPHSPSRPRPTISINTPEPLTPHTPKET
ncbi:transcription factor E2F7, partial [Neolamprologus brichardi]|uniref:transcription factor E2F7 n=1 Tax=Neolamprologus brichardi TaxID=32507 RepID=UPI0003EC5BE7